MGVVDIDSDNWCGSRFSVRKGFRSPLKVDRCRVEPTAFTLKWRLQS